MENIGKFDEPQKVGDTVVKLSVNAGDREEIWQKIIKILRLILGVSFFVFFKK